MIEFKTLKTDVVFFLVFVINSKGQSRNMIFWKRTCKIEMMMNSELWNKFVLPTFCYRHTEMKHTITCQQIFCSFTHPWPLDRVKDQTFFWRGSCCISNYKERSLDHYVSKGLTWCTTMAFCVGYKGKTLKIVQIELNDLIRYASDLSDGLRCCRNGIYMLW